MNITHISARFVKGQTFAHDISSKVTIFTGPNGIGKSARLDTIQLALLGYKPGLGEKNDKIFLLSGHNEMAVEVTLDCGQARRKWTRDGDSIKSNKKIDPSVPDLPAILLDHNEYFGLSADKRTEFFFGQVKIDTTRFNPNTLIAKLKGIKVANHTALHEELLNNFIAELSDSADVMRHSRSTLQEWLEAESVALTEKTKTTRATIDRMTKTIAGMTQLEIQHATALTESVPSLESRQGALRNELQTLALSADRLARLRASLRDIKNPSDALAMAKQHIAELQKGLDEPTGADPVEEALALGRLCDEGDAAIQALRANINDVTFKIEQSQLNITERNRLLAELEKFQGKSDKIESLNAEIKGRESEVSGYTSETRICLAQIANAIDKVVEGEKKLAEFDAALLKLQNELDEYLNSPTCPTCLAEGTEWQERLRNKYDTEKLSVRHQRQAHIDFLLHQRKAIDELHKKRMESESRDDAIDRLRAEIIKLKQERDNLVVAQAKHDKIKSALGSLGEIKDYSDELAALKLRKEAKEKDIAQAKQNYAQASERVQAWLEAQKKRQAISTDILIGERTVLQLENMVKDMASLECSSYADIEAQIASLDKRRVAIVGEINDISFQIKQSGGMQQDLKRNKEAELERNKAVAEMELLQAIRSELRAFQATIAATAFGPILSRANAITRSVLKAELTVEHGQLGRRDGERWISVDTFSQAQKAVTYAAMCYALAIDAPFKLVMIDNMNDMEEANATAFIKDIITLVENGTIDQFLGCDHRVYPYIDPATVGEHFPGSVDPVPMGKPFKGLTLIPLQ